MSNLIIESNVEIKNNKGRKNGSGSSDEYFLGNDIYEILDINHSIFFNSNLNPKNVLIRLNRLCKKNQNERVYKYSTDTKEIDGENVDGFRIHRVK